MVMGNLGTAANMNKSITELVGLHREWSNNQGNTEFNHIYVLHKTNVVFSEPSISSKIPEYINEKEIANHTCTIVNSN